MSPAGKGESPNPSGLGVAVDGRGRGRAVLAVGRDSACGRQSGRRPLRGYHCRNMHERKKKVYNTKAQNEGLKRSLRREGWIPCDVGVSCSMIGSPQSPDGMAGLVLQKRHRPWSDQGSEGSPKTPGPLPGPFLFSPGPSPDLLSSCLHPVQLFRLFSLPQSIGIAMPDSAVDDASHFCSFMDPRPRRSRLDLIHPSLEEARNHLTVARLKCHLGWHLFGFSSWKRWPLFVRARPDHHPSPS